jgi:hypothetical protein
MVNIHNFDSNSYEHRNFSYDIINDFFMQRTFQDHRPSLLLTRAPAAQFQPARPEKQTDWLLTVKIRQPSHEFTFGVGMSFIPYLLVLTPVV